MMYSRSASASGVSADNFAHGASRACVASTEPEARARNGASLDPLVNPNPSLAPLIQSEPGPFNSLATHYRRVAGTALYRDTGLFI